MIYVRPFRKEDFSAFVPIEPLDVNEAKDPEFVQAIEDSCLAVTGIRNGEIFGCGGCHPLNNEQGELWLRLSKDCLKYKLDTLRWLREGLKIIEEIYPFQQLNAIIRCNFDKSIKLVKFLGFNHTRTITDKGEKWLMFSKLIKE